MLFGTLTAQAKTVEYSTSTAIAIIQAEAAHFATPSLPIEKTLYCESRYEPNAYNPKDPNGGSFGPAQFQIRTFYKYAPLAGIENPDINDPIQQIQTTAYMFSIGKQNAWTCFRQIFGTPAP